MMKERHSVKFTRDTVPEDPDLIDNLFLAGVDMLLQTGLYNSDMGRVMKITEDEIYEGIKMAPRRISLGSGKDKCKCEPRVGNSKNRPVIQGGPTGTPISESIFTSVIHAKRKLLLSQVVKAQSHSLQIWLVVVPILKLMMKLEP